MKSTFLYLFLTFSLGFLQAQESGAVYLSFASNYESEFEDDDKNLEYTIFTSLRSWLSTYVRGVNAESVNLEEFVASFDAKADIPGEILGDNKKYSPLSYAEALKLMRQENKIFQVRDIKIAAVENKKKKDFTAYLNFEQGPENTAEEFGSFHGKIKIEQIDKGIFEFSWENIETGYWIKAEPTESSHAMHLTGGLSGFLSTSELMGVEFSQMKTFGAGYLWKNPISKSGFFSALVGGQFKYTQSRININDNTILESPGSPNVLQLQFRSAASEIQNRLSAEFHLGLDWTFSSKKESGWGLSALFTPRLGHMSSGYFEGRVAYAELWDGSVLIRDVVNCGLGTYGGEEAEAVRFSQSEFLFQPGFLLRPRWSSAPSSWGRIQLGIDAQIFLARGEATKLSPFLRANRGAIDAEVTSLSYQEQSAHQALSQGKLEWYAGLQLAYLFPSDSNRKSKSTDYDNLFSQEDRSGYEGKAYLILNGDISDAEAAERIRKDLGPATQFIWVINTTQLTNVEIPTMTELLSIKVNNNSVLDRISFADLNQVIDEIEVVDNPKLSAFDLPNIGKIFDAQFRNNDSLIQMQFDKLVSIEGSFRVSKNENLRDLQLPKLVEMDGRFYFSNNSKLEKLTFPSLTILHQDITLDQNSSIESLDLKHLIKVGGSFYISGNKSLEEIELPKLKIVSDHINIQNNDALSEFSSGHLTKVGGDFLISSNVNFTSFYFPILSHIQGDLTFSFNTSTQAIYWPSLDSIGGDILINAQDSLIDCSFEALTNVGGSIFLLNNNVLRTVRMPLLEEAYGLFDMQGTAIDSISLPSLKQAAGVRFGSNVNLVDIDLPKLAHLQFAKINSGISSQTALSIVQNSRLQKMNLPELQEIMGGVEIGDNKRLIGVEMPALTLISEKVRLANLDEFKFWKAPQLEEIGGDLIVKSNKSLLSFKLSQLQTLGGNTEITYNSDLRKIEFPLLSSVGGHFIASHNSLKPSTIDALLQTIVVKPPPEDARIRFNLQRPAATPSWKGLRASRELKRKGYDIVTD